MHTAQFEILPGRGIHWLDTGKDITFEMSLAEFDKLFVDGKKSQDDSGKV